MRGNGPDIARTQGGEPQKEHVEECLSIRREDSSYQQQQKPRAEKAFGKRKVFEERNGEKRRSAMKEGEEEKCPLLIGGEIATPGGGQEN